MDPEFEIMGLDRHGTSSKDSDRSNDNFSANEATSAEVRTVKTKKSQKELSSEHYCEQGNPHRSKLNSLCSKMPFFTLLVNAVSAVQNVLLRWKNKLALAVKLYHLHD